MKLLILLLLFSFNTYAEDILVFYSKGYVVSVDAEGNEKSIKKGDYLVQGETLKTGGGAFAILKIGKHSTHRVEERSEILIEKLPYQYEDSNELQQGGRFFLKLGTVFCEIYKKADNDSFEVKTKNTTMGVRGTKLMASIDKESKDTWLSVNEGIVEIHNNISKSSDIVTKDQSMIVEKDKNFTTQQKYDWQKNLKWDIEKNKDKFKSFRRQRKLAYKEFRQRRSSWSRNESRWSDFKKQRKIKLKKFRERVKDLKRNKSFKKRTNFKAKKVNKFRKKKTFYKKGMLDKNQKIEPNNFVKKKRKKLILQNNKDRLQNLRQKRRNQRRPMPRKRPETN